MKQHSLRPNAVTYKALVDVCCKCSDLAKAEATVGQMQVEGHVLDGATCNTLAHAFCKAGQSNKVLALIHTMRQMGVPATSALLQSFSVGYAGDKRALEDALGQLRRNVGHPVRGSGEESFEMGHMAPLQQ